MLFCEVISNLLFLQVEYTDLSMTVEGLVAHSSSDQRYTDVVGSLERLCDSYLPLRAQECLSSFSVVVTVFTCSVFASLAVLCICVFVQFSE